MNCEICESEYDRKREATYLEHGYCLCDDCRDAVAEAQYESFCEAYYGGSGPVTINEQYQAAAKARRELRKRD